MSRYRPLEKTPTINEALYNIRVEGLKKLARLVPLDGVKIPTRKLELIEYIIRRLAGDRLQTIWQGLDELQKAAVAEVVHSPETRFDADRFHAKYGDDPDWGSMDPYRRDIKPTALNFFFYGGIMPDDVKERCTAFVPEPVEATIETLEVLPAEYDLPQRYWDPETGRREWVTEPVALTVCDMERPAQRELLSVLRLTDARKIAVSTRTRRPAAATVKTLTTVLEGGDYYTYEPPESKWVDPNAGPIRAYAWPLLIQAGGLAQLSGSRLELTRSGRKALSAPAHETLRRLWNKWEGTTRFDELSRIDCVKGQGGRGKRTLTAIAGRRVSIIDTLMACPPGRWIEFDTFFRFISATGNAFAVAHNAWNLYIGESHYGSLGYSGCEGFLEQRYALCLLFEYAATLGLLDVAYIPPADARRDYHDLWGTDDLPYLSRYDGLLYFRINALGAYALDLNDAYTPAPIEAKGVLQVLPNLEVAAIGADLEPSDRLALDTYAEPVSDLVWRLGPEKVLAAVEQGRSVDEIRDYLTARSSAPLPDTVERLLDDCRERAGRLRDRGLARLIECADPALAALIANDAKMSRHCLPAGENHLVVPASSEAAFTRGLRKLGYLVAPDDVVAKTTPDS